MKLWFFKRETYVARLERMRDGKPSQHRYDTTQPPPECNRVNVELAPGDACSVLVGSTLVRIERTAFGRLRLSQQTVNVVSPQESVHSCPTCDPNAFRGQGWPGR